jgi:hypothetical protein
MEAENMKNMSFREASQTMYLWSLLLQIVWGTKSCAYSPRKRTDNKKMRVLAMPLKSCISGHD